MLEYELVRSKRKTLALYVRRDGRVEVRAPLRTSKAYIDDFVLKKRDWIENTQRKIATKQAGKKTIQLTAKEQAACRKKACEILQNRCQYYSEIMGLCPAEIRINSAKTRWGSCNKRGTINFTYRLLFVPEEAVDYVVVHELAHLKEMNHSPRFWAVVESVMPDFRARRKLLRDAEHQIELEIVSE